MLRYILVKLPGLTCISDVPVSSPCHVRMLRSLSPVKHDCREDKRRNGSTKASFKRSYSYPSARPRTENSHERHKKPYSEDKPQGKLYEYVVQRKDIVHRLKKPMKKQTEHVEIEKHKARNQKAIDHSKEFLMSENEIGEKFYDTYEVSEQYELESAKPRKSQSELTFNVFELMKNQENTHNSIEYLQPNNLKPFGSMENLQCPSLIKSKSSTFLRFPQGYDENEHISSERKYRRVEEIPHRGYSTSTSKLALFKLADHVEMIRNLPPIPISKYDGIKESKSQKQSDNIEVNNHESKNQSEMKSYGSFKLPSMEDDSVQQPANPPSQESNTVIKTLKPIETPWPSYADTLKGNKCNIDTEQDAKSVKSTTEPSMTETSQLELVKIDRNTSSTEKLQQIGKRPDDQLLRRSSFIQNARAASQRRTLSTEPIITGNSVRRTVTSKNKQGELLSRENPSVQLKSYSKKSRPLEPASCLKEDPPDKCFLPSKIRLKPPHCTPKPKPCPKKEPCIRADDCLKIGPKRLPVIPTSACPCIEPEVPEINPRLKRLNMTFQDPPRKCPCNPCPCPPRADDNLVEKPKKLFPLKSGDCICVEPPPMIDVPLKRLQKVCVPEEKCYPKKDCPKEEPCVRADDSLEVCEKPLPKLKVGPCPCIDEIIPEKNPRLRRLKLTFKDPPKVCPCEPTCPCPPRADDNIMEKPRKLPLYIPGECACIESPPMIDVPLKRLQKICIPEEKCYPKKKCPKPEPCIRADDCLKDEAKTLPVLKAAGCICKETFIPDKLPKMKRLEMVFEDEPKICPCDPVCPCPPRADDSLSYKVKKLPQLIAGECPCIEPEPLIDVPLKRLQKVCVPEETCKPKRICPPPEPCHRADDDFCAKPKPLPMLTSKLCPCIEEPPLKESPALKRLNLKVPEPPKVCPTSCVCNVDCPRADDQLKERKKSLPVLKAGHCPCIEQPLVDVGPLKRLVCEDEQEECPTEDPCTDYPRSDMGCWEYWTPEKNKCKSGGKSKNKKGVTVVTERKLNTDSRVNSHDGTGTCKQTTDQVDSQSVLSEEQHKQNDGIVFDCGGFNRVPEVWKEKNGWVIKKAKLSENSKFRLYRNPLKDSIPTVILLKELENVKGDKQNKILFNLGKETIPNIKGVLQTKVIHNDQGNKLPSTNIRNLSTGSQASGPRRESLCKKKKMTIKKKSVCHKIGETCELSSKLPCVADSCTATCVKPHKSICCDKKPSPYPAFSEMMEEEVEPFSEQKQWTCNRREFGFHPRYKRLNNPFNADSDKKHYTTTALKHMEVGITGEAEGVPIGVPVQKKCHQGRTSEKNTAHSETNIDSNRKTDFGRFGGKSNFSKIFSMNNNSPLISKVPRRKQPRCSLQIVRGMCFNASKRNSRISQTIAYRRGSTFTKKDKPKKCPKKKTCPKFKLQNCPPPEIRPKCKIEVPVICDKSAAPYPAFTDCLDEELAEDLSECPLEIEKVRNLQPRYIQPLDKPKLVKPVTPVLGKIDLKKEEACVREKLCLENKGLTQSCGEFGKPQKPMRAKHYLPEKKYKECEKIDELKKLGKWPPKNSRGLCTSAVNYLNFQKRNVSQFAKKPNTLLPEENQHRDVSERNEKSKQFHTLFQRNVEMRNYHILCTKPTKKIVEDDNEINKLPPHILTEDDSCRYNKLRNVQWRINNFQKWHRLNKLSNLPGYVKRFYSNIDTRNPFVNVQHGQKTYSTVATNMVFPCDTLDIPMQRGISTNFILAHPKKTEIEYIHVRKAKKCPKVTKSCPRFTTNDCSLRKRSNCSKKKTNKKVCKKQESPYNAFSDCNYECPPPKIDECPSTREQHKRLQPKYPILPEIDIPPSLSNSTFQGRVDPFIEAEYARQKYGIENEGVTQHCTNFGEKVNPLRVRMELEKIEVNNCKEEVFKDQQDFSVVVPEIHPSCNKIAEVPNVHFSSSAEVENITRLNVSNIHTNCTEVDKHKKTSKEPSQCIETKLSQKIEVTIPTSYKTCPEPPQDSQITQQSCEERCRCSCCTDQSEGSHEKQSKKEFPCPTSGQDSETLTVWQKIANYFKARPNCPAPDEWKKKAAKAKAEKYAKVAGLVVVDPKELPSKEEECTPDDLPTVITHHSCHSHKKNIIDSGKKSFSTTAILEHTELEKKRIGGCWNSLNFVNVPRPFHTTSEKDVTFNGHNCSNGRMKSGHEDGSTIGLDVLSRVGQNYLDSEEVHLMGMRTNDEKLSCSSKAMEKIDQDIDNRNNEFALRNKTMCRNSGHNSVFTTLLGSVSDSDIKGLNKYQDFSKLPEKTHGEDKYFDLLSHDHQSDPETSRTIVSSISLDSLENTTDKHLDGTNAASLKLMDGGSEFDNCFSRTNENIKKGMGLMNGKSPFITMMRRYYSKNANFRNLEEINKSLEEEEKKKKIYNKMAKPFMEGTNNIMNENSYDDISLTSQRNSEGIEDGDSFSSNPEAEDYISNRLCNVSYRKPGFFDVIFHEHSGIPGYNQAKTFAAFHEYFHKIEVLSDTSYEELEKVKTSNLLKELDKLIIDDKKQTRKS